MFFRTFLIIRAGEEKKNAKKKKKAKKKKNAKKKNAERRALLAAKLYFVLLGGSRFAHSHARRPIWALL